MERYERLNGLKAYSIVGTALMFVLTNGSLVCVLKPIPKLANLVFHFKCQLLWYVSNAS